VPQESGITAVAHAIQLSVAPVFLLREIFIATANLRIGPH
jgi:hypothetical protein